MAETTEVAEKTPTEKLRDLISQLKEMEHYSRSNVEKLSEAWLFLDDELKEKEFAKQMSDLLGVQNGFEEKIVALAGDIEIECNRRDNEAK